MTEAQQAWLDGLREMADWFEQNADMIPTHATFSALDFVYDSENRKAVDQLAEAARRMKPVEKEANDDYYFRVKKVFGPHEFGVLAPCERVVVGTEAVPEKVIEAYTREIVEWECAPSLLKAAE